MLIVMTRGQRQTITNTKGNLIVLIIDQSKTNKLGYHQILVLRIQVAVPYLNRFTER